MFVCRFFLTLLFSEMLVILYCFSIPFVYVMNWGWATIPATAIATFALLGVEGAAMECEIPFEENRTNHLRMDQYCETIVNSCALLTQWGGDEQAKKDLNGGRRRTITEEHMDEECETSSLHERREEINRRLSISKDHIALDVLNTKSDGTKTNNNNNSI